MLYQETIEPMPDVLSGEAREVLKQLTMIMRNQFVSKLLPQGNYKQIS